MKTHTPYFLICTKSKEYAKLTIALILFHGSSLLNGLVLKPIKNICRSFTALCLFSLSHLQGSWLSWLTSWQRPVLKSKWVCTVLRGCATQRHVPEWWAWLCCFWSWPSLLSPGWPWEQSNHSLVLPSTCWLHCASPSWWPPFCCTSSIPWSWSPFRGLKTRWGWLLEVCKRGSGAFL